MVQRSRNLCLYPNVYLMDQFSSQIRTYRPIAVDKTEVTIYCIAPKGEALSCGLGGSGNMRISSTPAAWRRPTTSKNSAPARCPIWPRGALERHEPRGTALDPGC